MSIHRNSILVAMTVSMFALTACYGTDDQLIPSSEGVLPVDQAVTVCKEAEDDCITFEAAGDGYINKVDPDAVAQQDALRLRFTGLGQIDGRQIYVLEMTSQLPDDPGTLLGLARRVPDGVSTMMNLEIAVLECGDLDPAERALFAGLGGQINQDGFVTMCTPGDLAMLKAFLHEAMWEEISRDEWWQANSPN